MWFPIHIFYMSFTDYGKSQDKMICGVCGGIAEYFGWETSLVRIAWVVFCLMGGSGILAYLIAAIIMPEWQGGNE